FSSRRRHTSVSRDWSSDVCSSDLHHGRFICCSVSSGLPARRPLFGEGPCALGGIGAFVELDQRRQLLLPRIERLDVFGRQRAPRSEERRVGQECSARCSTEDCIKK